MKRILFAAAISTLTFVGQIAHATYLDSSWYAQLTSVRTFGGNYSMDPFAGFTKNSSHIEVSASWGTASFAVVQSGQAADGEKAFWCGGGLLDPNNTLGNISFDYETYWTQPNLALVLTAEYLYEPYSQVVWSSATTGLRSGHVTLDYYPNGYCFRLAVVPEPAGLLSLGMLCGTGGLLGLRLHTLRRMAK